MLPENIHIKVLGSDNLFALIDLQNRIIATPETKYYLKDRTDADWRHILECPDYVVYGAFDGDKLIASATIHFPNGFDARDIPEFSPVPDTEIAIFQAVMVDAQYRGKGIMRKLQDLRKSSAVRRKRGKVICKISVTNIHSWKNTINYGFHCVKVAPDDTGHDKMYFIKKLNLEQGFLTK